jgi:hypothetical protein
VLSLESRPSGATVRVNDTDQGETPVTVGLDCRVGEPVAIEFSLRGHESTTHRTVCPRDSMITVNVRLKPGRAAAAPGRR